MDGMQSGFENDYLANSDSGSGYYLDSATFNYVVLAGVQPSDLRV